MRPAAIFLREVHKNAAIATAVLLFVMVWFVPSELGVKARMALLVFGLAIIGWTLTHINDATIALLAAVALVLTGVVAKDRLYQALGHELIWVLLATFMIATVLRATTLMQRFALAALRPARSMSGLVYLLTLVIGATAFIVPSTSGRAAVLLPVFLAIADTIKDPRLVRALALLFPSVILLSACGSLTGAAAHVLALEYMALIPGSKRIGYLEWLALAFPIALLSSVAAATVILRLFLTSDERAKPPSLPSPPRQERTAHDFTIVGIVLVTALLWGTSGWHAIGIGVAGLAAALLLTLPGVSGVDLKFALKDVEWELILFLAATLVIGDALIASGAATWIAGSLMAVVPQGIAGRPAIAALFVGSVASLAHLVVMSRSARAAVLIPTLALPLASLGHDPVALILLTAIGTGFSQTLTVSSKATVIYASLDRPTFAPRDLLALSLVLQPMFLVILLLALLYWWPHLGILIGKVADS